MSASPDRTGRRGPTQAPAPTGLWSQPTRDDISKLKMPMELMEWSLKLASDDGGNLLLKPIVLQQGSVAVLLGAGERKIGVWDLEKIPLVHFCQAGKRKNRIIFLFFRCIKLKQSSRGF